MISPLIVNVLAKILGSHTQYVLDIGIEAVKQYALRTRRAGMYAVLHHETTLELLNSKGTKAIHHKKQKVRFLQDNIVAYQDTVWGDGNVFAKYLCSPGEAVDRYREGHRYRVLISLRKTHNRNEIEDIQIKRTIENGFAQSIEEFQTEIDHFTDQLQIGVVFPQNRLPEYVLLIKQNAAQTLELGAEDRLILPDGRHEYRWGTQHPQRFEAYSLRWKW